MHAHDSPTSLPGSSDSVPVSASLPLSRDEQSFIQASLKLYKHGWFPMFDDETSDVQWYQPQSRGMIPLDARFRVPRSLRKRIRQAPFAITTDTAFCNVLRSCQSPAPAREETWLSDSIIELFQLFHRAGFAHSVEAWHIDISTHARTLVGGLYGICLGNIFAGESMFSRPLEGGTDASKICLVALIHHLRARGFAACDAQLSNPHLDQFGMYEIAAGEYHKMLTAGAGFDLPWLPFDGDVGRVPWP